MDITEPVGMSATGFDETLDRCSLGLSQRQANPQHFSPQAVILRVPQQAAGRPKAAGGLRRDMKPEGVRVRFKKKNKGPLGGGNLNILYFHPYLGKIPILTNIFQLGWNHQLGTLFLGFV